MTWLEDNMQDRVTCEEIALQLAQEMARERSGDDEEDYAPWGGYFITPKQRLYAAGKVGNC